MKSSHALVYCTTQNYSCTVDTIHIDPLFSSINLATYLAAAELHASYRNNVSCVVTCPRGTGLENAGTFGRFVARSFEGIQGSRPSIKLFSVRNF